MSTEHLSVRIYGESYSLRTGEPAARLEALARHVDVRMREVAASGKVVSTTKIAVLAALHIADELFRERERAEREFSPEAAARVRALIETLERALLPSAPARD